MIKTAKFEKSQSQQVINVTPKANFLNPSLTAATAAAAAAVAAQQEKQQFIPPSLIDASTKSKLLKNDSYLNKNIFIQQPEQIREVSLEKNIFPKSISQQQNLINNVNLVGPATTGPSMVSKRAALYEQKFNSDEAKQTSPQSASVVNSRRNSFNKSTVSPNKLITKIDNVNSPNEDLEMLSSSSTSSSSSSSYKENKRPQIEVKNDSGSNQVSESSGSGTNSSKEPSKLSISEKMKLFSAPNTKTLNVDLSASSAKPKSVKRNFNNRFQTQVGFSFSF